MPPLLLYPVVWGEGATTPLHAHVPSGASSVGSADGAGSITTHIHSGCMHSTCLTRRRLQRPCSSPTLRFGAPQSRFSTTSTTNSSHGLPCPQCKVKQSGARHCCQRGHHKVSTLHVKKHALQPPASVERPHKRPCLQPKRACTLQALHRSPHAPLTPQNPERRRLKTPHALTAGSCITGDDG